MLGCIGGMMKSDLAGLFDARLLLRITRAGLQLHGRRRGCRELIHTGAESSRTTQGAQTAVDACRYFAGLLVGALGGRKQGELSR